MTNNEIARLLDVKTAEKHEALVSKTETSEKSEKTKRVKKYVGKGHPGYYKGKKIDREKFMKAVNWIFSGGMPIREAYKYSGLSYPTFTKRANQLCTDGFIPGELVKDGEPINFEIQPIPEYEMLQFELKMLERGKVRRGRNNV